jgi:hypothetical protein
MNIDCYISLTLTIRVRSNLKTVFYRILCDELNERNKSHEIIFYNVRENRIYTGCKNSGYSRFI